MASEGAYKGWSKTRAGVSTRIQREERQTRPSPRSQASNWPGTREAGVAHTAF
jgi:hypothetical protein